MAGVELASSCSRVCRRGARLLVLAGIAWLAAVASPGPPARAAVSPCPKPAADPAYAASVNAALVSRQDIWGNRLLASPTGPTYAGAASFLHPLFLVGPPSGNQPGRLTESGAYYLALGLPDDAGNGASQIDLHVADGSQIVSQDADGARLTVNVGTKHRERFGSCLARLAAPQLRGGYLPILRTGYRSADGVHYEQESFATRIPQTRSLVSFLSLTIDPRHSGIPAARVRFTPSLRHLRRVGNQLCEGRRTVLVFSAGASRPSRPLVFSTAGGKPRTVFLAWLSKPSLTHPFVLDKATYRRARRALTAYWNRRLARAAAFVVPERRVYNAERNLLIQNLTHSWRYSLGNRYERFSWELLDVAEVMGGYGFTATERAIIEKSLLSRSIFPDRSAGEQMAATADYYRRTGDAGFVDRVTPELRQWVYEFEYELNTGGNGLLFAEPYGVDIPTLVYGLHDQAVALEGLRAMAGVWTVTGRVLAATEATAVANRLEAGLRSALASSARWLPDGSFFAPVALFGGEQPYGSLTDSLMGDYWNLVMPYALTSGLFQPGSAEAQGLLRYLLGHGSRLLGLVRFRSYTESGKPGYRSAGSDDVYGTNVVRFLADEEQTDQLVLSLYGKLAADMTQNTFVSGEGSTIGPVDGEYFRSMFRPPNSANNAFFLETLRLMLVHETRDVLGNPVGLELAFSTPRSWLKPGKRIVVRRAATSFGRLSYSLVAGAGEVRAVVNVPARVPPQSLRLRLRLPAGERIASVLLDGRAFQRFAPDTGTIDLSGLTGRLELLVTTTG